MDVTTTLMEPDTSGNEASSYITTSMTPGGTVSSVQSEAMHVNTSQYKVCDSVISKQGMCSGVKAYGHRKIPLVAKITPTLNDCMAYCYCKHLLFMSSCLFTFFAIFTIK